MTLLSVVPLVPMLLVRPWTCLDIYVVLIQPLARDLASLNQVTPASSLMRFWRRPSRQALAYRLFLIQHSHMSSQLPFRVAVNDLARLPSPAVVSGLMRFLDGALQGLQA